MVIVLIFCTLCNLFFFFFWSQVNRLKNEGYYGGVRLLMAICNIFNNYCKDNQIELHDRNFTLSYDTNIPRQVIPKPPCTIIFYVYQRLLPN